MVEIGNSWDDVLSGEFEKEYYQELRAFLKQEYAAHTVYPPMDSIFRALKETPYDKVKAVIIGQDPYHEPGQAQGLCFSVPKGIKQPPSLVNIFKEMRADLGITPPSHGNLESWARAGVLLLNDREDPVVFILWGANAKAKAALVTNDRHCIITGAHPSPLSAHNGFWGGRYFSRTNEFLEERGFEPINWRIAE